MWDLVITQIVSAHSSGREQRRSGDFLQGTISHLAGEQPLLLIGMVSSGQVNPILILRAMPLLKDNGKSEECWRNEEMFECMREPESEENSSKSYG